MLARARAEEKNYSNFASRRCIYVYIHLLSFFLNYCHDYQSNAFVNQSNTDKNISRIVIEIINIFARPLRFYLFILFYFFLNCRGATCARAMLSRSLLVFLPAENYSRFYWKLAAGSIYNLFSSFFLTSFTFIFLSCYIN